MIKKTLVLVPLNDWITTTLQTCATLDLSALNMLNTDEYDIERTCYIVNLRKNVYLNLEQELNGLKLNNPKIIDTYEHNNKSDFSHFCCIEEILEFIMGHAEDERKNLAVIVTSGDRKFLKIARYLTNTWGISFVVYAPEGTIAKEFFEFGNTKPIEIELKCSLNNDLKKLIVRYIFDTLKAKKSDDLLAPSFRVLSDETIKNLQIDFIQFQYVYHNLMNMGIIKTFASKHPESGDQVKLIEIDYEKEQTTALLQRLDGSELLPF